MKLRLTIVVKETLSLQVWKWLQSLLCMKVSAPNFHCFVYEGIGTKFSLWAPVSSMNTRE